VGLHKGRIARTVYTDIGFHLLELLEKVRDLLIDGR
jgi:hypothetical protein